MQFSAVVLDISMPDIDGFAVLEAMATHDYTRNIPTLMLASDYDMYDVNRALHLGAKDYLAKPFDDSQIIFRVTRLLRGAAAPDPFDNIAGR
jgi:PleD family two-component response regulator